MAFSLGPQTSFCKRSKIPFIHSVYSDETHVAIPGFGQFTIFFSGNEIYMYTSSIIEKFQELS